MAKVLLILSTDSLCYAMMNIQNKEHVFTGKKTLSSLKSNQLQTRQACKQEVACCRSRAASDLWLDQSTTAYVSGLAKSQKSDGHIFDSTEILFNRSDLNQPNPTGPELRIK